MSKLACKCPKCKASLRFESGEKKELKIKCPKCQHPFLIKVKSSAAPTDSLDDEPLNAPVNAPIDSRVADTSYGAPAANAPLGNLLQDLPPMESYSGQTTYRPPQISKRSSFDFQKLVLPAVIVVGSIGGIGLVVAGIIWGKQFLPQESPFSGLSNTLSSSVLLGGDSSGSIEAEHQKLRTQTENLGNSIPGSDQSEESAQKLLAEIPKFNVLFLRACRLPATSKTMQEFVTARAETRASLEGMRNQAPAPGSPNYVAPFWSINTSPAATDLVVKARNEVTEASFSVALALSGQTTYPDPMTYSGPEFDWSDDDKQVLAFIHLQGNMQRDTLRALAAVDAKSPSARDLANVHTTIDRYVELAKVVRKIPRKTSSLIAFVPKVNPYEGAQRATDSCLMRLRKIMESESALKPEIDFLFKEVDAFTKVCEGHLFGFQGKLPEMIESTSKSAERFRDYVAAEEKKKEEAQKAEIAKQEKEKQRIAEEAMRRQKAEERQREEEAERARIAEERNRKIEERAAKTAARSEENRNGPGGFDNQSGFGPRGNMGFGPMGNNGPPNFTPPGFGARPPGFPPSGFPQDPFQPPGANFGNQGDPAKLVTITSNKVKNTNASDYTSDLPKWLLQYSPMVMISNGDLKITLQNFDKPLSEIEACFPMLVFEKIDNERRTIVAKEK